jgi:cellulose biosynthesis protein BcsQ
MSGKGGVGKSTVTGQLAYALAAYFESEEKQV